jgi:hypothetical protein
MAEVDGGGSRMTESDDVYAHLREWAAGSLPIMAAVEFLASIPVSLYVGHPMIRGSHHYYLDVFELDDDEWSDRTGHMSGGEQATWQLVRSIVEGELGECFWRLDGHRQHAFLYALTTNT